VRRHDRMQQRNEDEGFSQGCFQLAAPALALDSPGPAITPLHS
jgi:hypothetical protein